jgi:hypothetical protein
MARTFFAAIVDAPGILQAVVLARIGGSSQPFLVGASPMDEKHDHDRHEGGEDDEDLLHDARHGSEEDATDNRRDVERHPAPRRAKRITWPSSERDVSCDL